MFVDREPVCSTVVYITVQTNVARNHFCAATTTSQCIVQFNQVCALVQLFVDSLTCGETSFFFFAVQAPNACKEFGYAPDRFFKGPRYSESFEASAVECGASRIQASHA